MSNSNTDNVFKMSINRETLDKVFTSFIRAMGYVSPHQELEIESLVYDSEEEVAQIEGNVIERTLQ